MKIIVTLCSGIIMIGVAYSLYNAANDYGLATISLPPAITAQDDDTSGGDKTSGGNIPGVRCYYKLESEKIKGLPYFTDNRGAFTHIGGTACCFKPNVWYDVCIEYFFCAYSGLESDTCDSQYEEVFLTSVVERDDSSGDGTF